MLYDNEQQKKDTNEEKKKTEEKTSIFNKRTIAAAAIGSVVGAGAAIGVGKIRNGKEDSAVQDIK